MIVIFSRGQMANHLFQYMCVVKLAEPKEKIIVIGMTELYRVFETLPHQDHVTHISTTGKRWVRAFFRLLIDRSFSFLTHKRIFRSYTAKQTIIQGESLGESGEVQMIDGQINSLAYARGNFQSPQFYNKQDIKQLVPARKYMEQAQKLLQPYADKKRVFIHIRRGDYLAERFRPLGKSAVLPNSYYLEAIAKHQSTVDNPEDIQFIVVTDDLNYSEEFLQGVDNKLLYKNSMPIDFCLMALCDGGILSASSFSYWGAMLAIHNNAQMNFYAPKYWLGFRSKVWFPNGVKCKFLHYIDAGF